MLVTLDIDDTIRLHGSDAAPEQPINTWRARLFYREPVRAGFCQLCRELREMGCRVGIYTTSERSAGYIRRWMRCYGLTPDLIVNATAHAAAISGKVSAGRSPSKHPGLFGVDLHVDDAPGVAIEGERFGFRTLIVDPSDSGWNSTILTTVKALMEVKR